MVDNIIGFQFNTARNNTDFANKRANSITTLCPPVWTNTSSEKLIFHIICLIFVSDLRTLQTERLAFNTHTVLRLMKMMKFLELKSLHDIVLSSTLAFVSTVTLFFHPRLSTGWKVSTLRAGLSC